MNDQQETDSLLTPFRALDLTDEKGFLCGKILGDLGADVIKVELPGGDPARNIGPFYEDVPDPEKSLYWFAFNNNKRGIILNISTSEGQDIFKRLVESADFVIESFPPGYMDGLGLGYPQLSQINPRIVMTSITPFGQSGPYKDYKASDIVAVAMSGLMYVTGDPDRPPVRISFPQAYCHAGAEAAVGTMIAHHHREVTGEGQHVDVSMQASLYPTLFNALLFWEFSGVNLQRAGPCRVGYTVGGTAHRVIWPCQDGYVCLGIWGGVFGEATNRGLVEWMDSEGKAPDFLKKIDWASFDYVKAFAMGKAEEIEQLLKPIGDFLLIHTKGELWEEAQKRNIMLYPVLTAEEILNDPQLSARDFWQKLEHPELGSLLTYPGPFVKSTQTAIKLKRRAPLIGEHNIEIYEKEMGFSREEILTLKQGGII